MQREGERCLCREEAGPIYWGWVGLSEKSPCLSGRRVRRIFGGSKIFPCGDSETLRDLGEYYQQRDRGQSSLELVLNAFVNHKLRDIVLPVRPTEGEN